MTAANDKRIRLGMRLSVGGARRVHARVAWSCGQTAEAQATAEGVEVLTSYASGVLRADQVRRLLRSVRLRLQAEGLQIVGELLHRPVASFAREGLR